jgi:hypothetical protein
MAVSIFVLIVSLGVGGALDVDIWMLGLERLDHGILKLRVRGGRPPPLQRDLVGFGLS